MNKQDLFICIYLIISFTVFLVFGWDKYKAVHHQRRIPENTLLLLSVFSPVGALLGMLIFHHKIRKKKFTVTVPIIFVVELLLLLKLKGL